MALPTTSSATFRSPLFFHFSAKPHHLRPKSTTQSVSPPPLVVITAAIHLRSPNAPILDSGNQTEEQRSCRRSEDQPESSSFELEDLLAIAIQNQNLRFGRSVHAAVVKNQVGNGESILLTMLVSFYGKLGRILDARKVFDEMPSPNVVSYSSLISCYAWWRWENQALELFLRCLQSSDVEPNEYTYVAALSACISSSNLRLGSELHALVVKTNYASEVYVGNALMSLCIRDGRLDDAVRFFDRMPDRHVTSWHTILCGMAKEQRYHQMFDLFHHMRIDVDGVDHVTLSSLLMAAVRGPFPEEGRGIHAIAIKEGLELDSSIRNGLIAFYTDFGDVEDVVYISQRTPNRDVQSWTGMVNGFVEFGETELALEPSHQMLERNISTFESPLEGFCGNNDKVRAVDDFWKMVEAGMEFSDFTLSSAVNACASAKEPEKSRQLHAFVIKVGCESNPWIKAALLDMCVKCNRVDDGRKILDRWSSHEKGYLVAWTSMVWGYLHHKKPDEALSLLNGVIRKEGLISVDEVAVSLLLEFCQTLGFIGIGKQIHCHAIKTGYVLHVGVGNTIFNMYSKCGYIDDALKFFHSMHAHDMISWGSLLTAHLHHRQGDEALAVWRKMESEGTCVDEVNFLLILSACKYTSSDSTDICRSLLASMVNFHGIKPSEEHYACFVEVLCQWNRFSEAEELINNMPMKPGATVWKALLHCCRVRGNQNLGRKAMQHVLALKPVDPPTYVLISNIYASCGRWHCAQKLREEMKKMGLHKHPAQSWVVHQNKLHLFYTRDRSHPQNADIYGALDILILESMKAGYVPDNSFVFHEVEEYQKKEFLFYHSAKLAIAFAILFSDVDKPIRAMKSVSLCGDCHSFMKIVSLVTRREIIFRDGTGLHHFRYGKCTCRDYW